MTDDLAALREYADTRFDALEAATSRDFTFNAALSEERTRHLEARIDDSRTFLLHRDEAADTALAAAKDSSDRAILAASVALTERLETTAQALRAHIELQMETARLALAADKEATRLALEALMGLLAERDKALKNAREEQRLTESKDRADLDLRLEGMNQFRRQIEQERGDYVRRESFTQMIADMDRRVEQQFVVVATRSEERMLTVMARIDSERDERQSLREQLLRLDARSAENTQSIRALSTNPVDMSTIRGRLDAVESRPIAMMPDERGALKAAIVEAQRDMTRLHKDFHDQGNALQALKSAPTQFTPAEVEDIRQIMRVAVRAGVIDALTNDEVKALRDVLKGAGVRNRRFTLFEAAVISGVVLTILSIVAVVVTKLLA